VIKEKTEAERLEEHNTAINSVFTSFASSFGDSSSIFGGTTGGTDSGTGTGTDSGTTTPTTPTAPTEHAVKEHASATTATMDIASAFSFFGGNAATKATVYVPKGTTTHDDSHPEEGQAATTAPTQAQSHSIFASMFGGGFNIFGAFG